MKISNLENFSNYNKFLTFFQFGKQFFAKISPEFLKKTNRSSEFVEASGKPHEASEFFKNFLRKFIRNNQLPVGFLNFWGIFNFKSQFMHEFYKDS